MKGKNLNTIDECLRDAVREAASAERCRIQESFWRNDPKNQTQSNQSKKHKGKEQQVPKSHEQDKDKPTSSNTHENLTCLNCGKKDHKTLNCPEPKNQEQIDNRLEERKRSLSQSGASKKKKDKPKLKGPTSGILYKIEVSSYNDDVDSLSNTSDIWYTHGSIAQPNDILFLSMPKCMCFT